MSLLFHCDALECSEASSSGRIFQASLPLREVKTVLLVDPRSSKWSAMPEHTQVMYNQLQRQTHRDRRKDIRNYILDRVAPCSQWIGTFPPIVIGMFGVPDYDSSTKILSIELGETQNYCMDGLTRVTGYLDALEDSNVGPEIKAWLNRVSIPVMFVVSSDKDNPLTFGQMGQLFADFSTKSKPISKAHAGDLDKSDLYQEATRRVGNLRVICDNGGFNERGSGRVSTKFLTGRGVLVKAIRAAAEGPGNWVDHMEKKSPNPFMKNLDAVDVIVRRWDEFLTRLIAESGKTGPEFGTGTILRTPSCWIALGLFLHDLYNPNLRFSEFERNDMIRELANFDWSLGNPSLFPWFGQTDGSKTDEKGRQIITSLNGRQNAFYTLARLFRHHVHLQLRLSRHGLTYGDESELQWDDFQPAA